MLTSSIGAWASQLRASSRSRHLRSSELPSSRTRSIRTAPVMGIQFVTTDGLDAGLGKLQSGYIHFRSDWCPDCIRSNDAVLKVVSSAGHDLIVCDVGDRPTWKNPANPLRSDPRFKLSGIPTLVHWKGGQPVAKLGSELERAPTTAAAQQAIEAFIASQSSS